MLHISDAILRRFPPQEVNFKELETKISSYLAIAGDRDGGRKKRNSKGAVGSVDAEHLEHAADIDINFDDLEDLNATI